MARFVASPKCAVPTPVGVNTAGRAAPREVGDLVALAAPCAAGPAVASVVGMRFPPGRTSATVIRSPRSMAAGMATNAARWRRWRLRTRWTIRSGRSGETVTLWAWRFNVSAISGSISDIFFLAYHLAECGERTSGARLHGSRGDAEQPCGLGFGKILDESEDDHLALVER